MTESVDCPLCEYTAEGDTIQAARNSVRSHMSSKVDPDHKGVGYQKATQLLDIQDTDIPDTASASAPQPSDDSGALGDTDDGRDPVRADGGGLGLEGKPDVDPSDATDDAGGADREELDCTGCDEALGVTAAELAEDPDIEPGDVLVCECGHQMEYNP